MEIVQQKLAWVMAMAAMLTLVYKLDLRGAGIGGAAIRKVKAGLILNLAGALASLVLRIGFTSDSFPHSTVAVLIETLGGYVLGWTFVIWGLIQGLGSFFDLHGRLKTDLVVGKLSKDLSSSLLNGSGPTRIMEELAEDLLKALWAEAVTLHRVDETGQLRLSYSVGLTPASRNLIRRPEKTKTIYQACMTSDRPVIADNPGEITDGRSLELVIGPARSALCFPAAFNGRIYGLVAVYRAGRTAFQYDDCEIMRIASDGLGLALWRQSGDDAERTKTRFREIISLASRYFVAEKSLVSAMIKTAKLIHGHILFEKIRLNIAGHGKPHFLDFNLSTGGVISIGTGFFSERDDFASSIDFRRISDDVFYNAAENAYFFPVEDGQNRIAELTIMLGSTAADSDSLSMFGAALGREIAGHLRKERLAALKEKTAQRLGAIGMFLEKAESVTSLSRFLDDIASAVVDLTPATICRIVLIESRYRYLKSAALAQVRELKQPLPDVSGVRSDDLDICRRALGSGDVVNFGSRVGGSEESASDYSRLMPLDMKRGTCLPLRIGGRAVGLMIVGDARQTSRSETGTEDMIFISAVADLVSMVLAMHGNKLQQTRPGSSVRKLTLRKKELQREPLREAVSLSDRSRINGPLAGILASCEYLRSRPQADLSEVGRFIDIIQRNAARIHSLTSETNIS